MTSRDASRGSMRNPTRNGANALPHEGRVGVSVPNPPSFPTAAGVAVRRVVFGTGGDSRELPEDLPGIDFHDGGEVEEARHAHEIAAAFDDAEVRWVDADGEAELPDRPAALNAEPFDDQAEADGVGIAGCTLSFGHATSFPVVFTNPIVRAKGKAVVGARKSANSGR